MQGQASEVYSNAIWSTVVYMVLQFAFFYYRKVDILVFSYEFFVRPLHKFQYIILGWFVLSGLALRFTFYVENN